MNRLEKRPPAAAEAQIQYLDGDIRVIRPGAFVRCAVTGVRSRSTNCAIGASTSRKPMPTPRRSSSASTIDPLRARREL